MYLYLKNKNYYSIKKLLIVALSFMLGACSSSVEPLEPKALLTQSKLVELPNAQVIVTFPEPNPSSRKYVNNRGTFKAYKGHGQLLIQNHSAKSADIYINNQLLNIKQLLGANTVYQYSLAKLTHNGVNTLKLEPI